MAPTIIRKIENETEEDEILNRTFTSAIRSTGFVEVGNDKICLPALYTEWNEKMFNFEVKDDDVYICGHLKTGTTWLQELVWLVSHNLDYENAEIDVVVRVPLLEYPIYMDTNVVNTHLWFDHDVWEYVNHYQPSPRVYKTHLHWSLLPRQIQDGSKQPKIISILRHPLDTFISYYHHCKNMEGYKGTLGEMCKLFLSGRNLFGPYWKSVLSLWAQRDRPNVLFVKFKDMKENLPGVIRKVAEFLENPLTDEEVTELAKHLSFEEMKKNSAVNMRGVINMYAKKHGLHIEDSEFMRSGNVGGYKTEMSPEMIQKLNRWVEENMSGTGISFD